MTSSAPGASQGATGLYVLVVLTFGAYLPSALYPGYQQAFQVDDLTMTWIYAVFALVSAPALLLLGSASDALGARQVLLAGIAVAAVGSACFVLADGAEWLIVGRAAQGLSLGASTSAAAVLVSEADGNSRQRGAVLTSIAFVAGTAAGAVAGGVLVQYAPAPQLLPFSLHLALLGIGWCRVFALSPSIATTRHMQRWKLTIPRIPKGMRGAFAAASAVGFLAWAAAGLFLAIIPTLLKRSGQTNMAATGGILGALLLFSALSQPLVARFGPRFAQLAGLGALLVSFGLLAVTAGGSIAITSAGAGVAGVGHGLAYAGAAAAIDAKATSNERGAVTGALYLAFYLGSGLPAVAVGLLTLQFPLAVATSMVTSVAVVLVILTGILVICVDRCAHTSREITVRREYFRAELQEPPVSRARTRLPCSECSAEET